MAIFLFLFVASFLIGSIPVGYLIGRSHGVDIRRHGSGNIGATNIGRTLGKRAGVLTLIADALKGALGATLVFLIPDSLLLPIAESFAALIGFTAILGHCFSPFLRGRGGKGVATAMGVFLVVAPLETLAAAVIFAAVLFSTRYVSLSSISAAVSLPVFVLILNGGRHEAPVLLASMLAACLILYRHKTNILQLQNGTEPKFANSTAAAATETPGHPDSGIAG